MMFVGPVQSSLEGGGCQQTYPQHLDMPKTVVNTNTSTIIKFLIAVVEKGVGYYLVPFCYKFLFFSIYDDIKKNHGPSL